MRRQTASDSLRYMAFSDSYGTITDRQYYLQQRWNHHDISDDTPLVGQLLERSFLLSGPDTLQRRQYQQHLYDMMGLKPLLGQYIIALSSGELRKFQLAKTLMAQPTTLILDEPYIGLDTEARALLTSLLDSLLSLSPQLCLYLVLSRPGDVPPFVTHIQNVKGQVWPVPEGTLPTQATTADSSKSLTTDTPVAEMRHVTIAYGERTILSDLSWTIHQGECWALTGSNGSGKSTLLSLICGDNPMAYAHDIRLFGRQRGSGESIWDIKRRIGYVSPELARSYQRPLPALHVVASGLKDTVGLYVHPTEAECRQCMDWMHTFGVDDLAHRPFTQLSGGEQRLLLVCRAFVKNPQLLILDEPLHGLDEPRRQLVRTVIERYCRLPDKTLIMVTHYPEELPACITDHKILTNTNDIKL